MEAKVDSLLEELNSLLDSSNTSISLSTTLEVKTQDVVAEQTVDATEDLDFLIESLSTTKLSKPSSSQHLSTSASTASLPSSTSLQSMSSSVASVVSGKFIKCFTIYLGPSNIPRGLHQSQTQCCKQLFCTTCDLQVLEFNNKEWIEPNCNYLFFRNNYPTEQYLKVNLQPKQHSSAYCCQCSWVTVTVVTDLRKHDHLRWFCKGHAI